MAPTGLSDWLCLETWATRMPSPWLACRRRLNKDTSTQCFTLVRVQQTVGITPKIVASLQDYSVGKSSCPQIHMVAGLYAGSNYCQSRVLVDTLMLTVKLVYKLSNCA